MPLRHRSRRFSSRSWFTAERFCFNKANSPSASFTRYHAAQITNPHRNINALWRSMRLSMVTIGRFLSVRRWMKQRKKQIRLTTAELALHYGGLGAGPPTSEVQEVKRLHCLPMQIVLLLPCLLQWFQTSSVPANRGFLLPAPQPRWQSRQNAPEFGSPHSFA